VSFGDVGYVALIEIQDEYRSINSQYGIRKDDCHCKSPSQRGWERPAEMDGVIDAASADERSGLPVITGASLSDKCVEHRFY
jgi:hypothetical protein